MPSRIAKKRLLASRRKKKKLVMSTVVSFGLPSARTNKRTNTPMDWETRVRNLPPRQFLRRYRIDHAGFKKIVERITPYLAPRSKFHPNQTSNELKLSMTLRWCAGASYLDVADMHGVSEGSFYRHLWETIYAIDQAYELPLYGWLNGSGDGVCNEERLAELARGFDAKTTGGHFAGCIGALDGICIKLDGSTLSSTGNPAAFWCRKGFYSLNFQCICDADGRILWCSTLCSGSAHDSTALRLSQLGKLLMNPRHPIQHSPYWIAGDDAYKGPANESSSLLTPFGGTGLSADKDAFNYYQSRLRMAIECCFGSMVHRWGVLQRKLKLTGQLAHCTKLLHVLCKLQNVCTESKLPEHRGRVMTDEYEGRHAADLRGVDWAEWDIPEEYLDKPQGMGSARRATANAQPLREVLRGNLDRTGLERAAHSTYAGYQ